MKQYILLKNLPFFRLITMRNYVAICTVPICCFFHYGILVLTIIISRTPPPILVFEGSFTCPQFKLQVFW